MKNTCLNRPLRICQIYPPPPRPAMEGPGHHVWDRVKWVRLLSYKQWIWCVRLGKFKNKNVTFLIEIFFLHAPQRKKTRVPWLESLVSTLLQGTHVCVVGKILVSCKNLMWDLWSLIFPISLPRFIRTLLYIFVNV